MPVYIRKRTLNIQSPSEKDWSKTEEEDFFLQDPDQALDCLPQPYRMIVKIVNRIFDQSWESVQAREEHREAERLKKKNIAYQPTDDIKQFDGRANCIASTGTGRYIFVGLTNGLVVFSTPSYIRICGWEAAEVEISIISACQVPDQSYLIGTVDNMGTARLFYFYVDHISLIKAINELEDISKRTICMKLGFSQGGDYAGVLLQGGGESWLEVYRLPKDSWLKELDQSQVARPHKGPEGQGDENPETVGSVETKVTPPALIMKIKSPRPLTGSHFKTASEALQKTDESNVIGSGHNHVISAHQWEHQEAVFYATFKKYLDARNAEPTEEKKPSEAVFYFLLPGKILQMGSDGKSLTGMPNAIGVHWNDRHNLYQYLLVRPHKEKSDSEPKPEVVWPCAAPIICSAASSCTSYLALGCEDGTITIWDIKYSGSPLAVVALPEGCHMQDIYFLENSNINTNQMQFPSIPARPKVQILAWCTSGSLYLIMAAWGKETNIILLRDSSKTPDELISAVIPVPTLPNTVLLISREGQVELLDSAEQEVVCQFDVPISHMVATPWQPVFALDPVNLCLYLRGDQRLPPDTPAHASDVPCSIFCFSFEGLSFMETFLKKQESIEAPLKLFLWDRRCELIFQNRLQSQVERCKQLPDCWEQLQKCAKAKRHRN
ncbi:WD repeat-containing protein 93 isoform X2 [Microcaecilia unicolor]|uniref:WD repeat-containing protein 93 isoform X2 n=1 Tax=Microcaecilia unicolor TaxID=1415580 RepID=A0A6P7WQR4_9AMPH|nr:WD repeat-containing protein 93 isoform X2 [Microcaecilia unicolor]